MTLKLITAPATEPVTLAEAKLQCRVEHVEDDAWFTGIAIPSARRAAEHMTGRAFITQTWERVIDAFPAGAIDLPKPKVLSIVSVKYIDDNEVEQTLASDQYVLDTDDSPGWLLLANDASWPSTYNQNNAVRVRFTAGYGAAGDVPAQIKLWMLMQIAAAYRNREAFAAGVSVSELPNRFVDSLLDAERAYL